MDFIQRRNKSNVHIVGSIDLVLIYHGGYLQCLCNLHHSNLITERQNCQKCIKLQVFFTILERARNFKTLNMQNTSDSVQKETLFTHL